MTSGKEYVVAISAPEETLEQPRDAQGCYHPARVESGAGAPPSAETTMDDQDDDASERLELYKPDTARVLEYSKLLFNFVQIVDSVGAAIKVEWPRGCACRRASLTSTVCVLDFTRTRAPLPPSRAFSPAVANLLRVLS